MHSFVGSRQSTPGDVEERLNGRGDGRRFRGGRERGGPPPPRGRGSRGGRGSNSEDYRRRGRDEEEVFTEDHHVENKYEMSSICLVYMDQSEKETTLIISCLQ